jgi:hypothetical protein
MSTTLDLESILDSRDHQQADYVRCIAVEQDRNLRILQRQVLDKDHRIRVLEAEAALTRERLIALESAASLTRR